MIDTQIAAKIGISASTLYEWKNKYPQLAEALSNGKEVIDIKVENALLKRALGYSYEETRREGQKGGTAKITVITKYMPPDVTAQIFWLKNRKPEMWRERVEMASDDGALNKLDELIKGIDNAAK